jgi:hypothetical protein
LRWEVSGALIRFVCRNAEHQIARNDISSPVTLHEHEWAFCPAGVITDHAWERVEGTTLEALRTPRGASEAVSDTARAT